VSSWWITEPRRGALQHFYRATGRPILDETQWRTLPAGLRQKRSGETLQELVDDLAAAADAGQLADPELVVARTPLELDERALNKLNRLLARTLEQAQTIAAESAARSHQGADAVATELAILHFKRALPSRSATP
jgi:hypothetical protein